MSLNDHLVARSETQPWTSFALRGLNFQFLELNFQFLEGNFKMSEPCVNNWSCSLIARALTDDVDSGDGMVSVAIVAVTMRSMPSKSVCINCSSSSKDTYTEVFLKSRSLQRFALPYRTIYLPRAIRRAMLSVLVVPSSGCPLGR